MVYTTQVNAFDACWLASSEVRLTKYYLLPSIKWNVKNDHFFVPCYRYSSSWHYLFNLCGVYWNNYYSPQCWWIVYNYPPKGRSIVVHIIYRDAKRRGIYPPLFTDPEGDSCFSIYQIRWIKKRFFNFFFWNFCETTHHFSLRSQNSE